MSICINCIWSKGNSIFNHYCSMFSYNRRIFMSYRFPRKLSWSLKSNSFSERSSLVYYYHNFDIKMVNAFFAYFLQVFFPLKVTGDCDWSPRDTKSFQLSWTVISTLADLSSSMVLAVPIHPRIFNCPI